LSRRIHAWPDLDLLGVCRHTVDDLVEDALFDEQARTSATTLTLVEEIALATPGMLVSTAASLHTMLGDFPPSSNDTFFRFPAAAPRMSFPTSVEPVKATVSTSGWDRQGCSELPRRHQQWKVPGDDLSYHAEIRKT
jgi:hypothetical protein